MLMEFGLRVENTPFTPMNSSDENSISYDSIIQYLGVESKNIRIAIFTPNQISLKKFTSKTKQFGIGNDGFPDSADFFLFKLFVAQSLVQNHAMNIAVVSTYNYSASCYVIARWLIDEKGYKFTQAIGALKKALPGKEIGFGLKEKLIKRYNFNGNPIYCQPNQLPFYNDTEEMEEKMVLIDSPQKNDIIDQVKRKPPKPPPLPNSKTTPQIENEKFSPERKITTQNTIVPNNQSNETNPSQQSQPTKQLQVKQTKSLTKFDENSQKQQWPVNSLSKIEFFEDSPQKKEETGQTYQSQKQSYYTSNQQKQEQQMNFSQSYTYPYQYEEIHVLNSNSFNQQSHHQHHQHSEVHNEEKHKHHHHQNSDYQYYYNQDSYDHFHENPTDTYNYPDSNTYDRYYQHEANAQALPTQPPQNYSNDSNYYTYDVPDHSDPYQTSSYYDQRGYYSNYDHQQQSYQQHAQSYYSYNEQQNPNRYPYPSHPNMASAYPPPQANYDYPDRYPPDYQNSYQYIQQYQNEYPEHDNYNYNYHYNYHMQSQYHPPPSQPPPIQNDRPEYHDMHYDRPTSLNKYNYNNPQHIPPDETSTYHPDPQSYYNPPEPHHPQQPPKDQIVYPNDQKSSLKIEPIQIPPPSLPPLPPPSPPPLPPPPPPIISKSSPQTKSLLDDQKDSQNSDEVEEVEEIDKNPHFHQISSIGSNYLVFNRIPISRVGFDSSPDEFVEVCKDISTILAIKNLNIQNIKSLPFTHEEQLTDESFEVMKNCSNKEFMFRPIPAGDRCFLVARGSKRFLISNDMCREVKVSLFSPNSENIIQNAVRSLFEGFLIRLEDEDKPYFLITDCFNVNVDFSQLPYVKRLDEAEKMVVMQQSKNNIQDNLLLRAVETFQINQFDEIQSQYHFDYEILGFTFFSPNSVRQSLLNQFNNENNSICYEIDNSICCNCMFNWFKDDCPIVQINISGNMKCVGLARRNGTDELIEAVDFGFAKKTMLRFNKKIVDLEYSSNLQKWQIKCISSKYKTWYADDVKNIIYGKEIMPYEEVKLKIDELISS